MRRCVIDLSDSEDDGDGDVHHIDSERGQRIYSPLPTRAHTTSSMPHIATGGDWAPPQHHTFNGNSGTQSPAALFAKEEEIKKMRELIAMREQSRLKKLAAVCLRDCNYQFHSLLSHFQMSRPASTSINNPPAASEATTPLSDLGPTIKQEEDESSTGLTPLPKNGVPHATNGHSHNATEHVRMQDVVSG
jgi:hypothetical protein